MTNIEKQFFVASDKSPSNNSTNGYLVQQCSHCDENMELKEGDVIFGDKWFHNDCWNLIKGGTKNVSH